MNKKLELNKKLESYAESGDLLKLKEVIKEGADPNYNKGYALIIAVKNNNLNIVKYFINYGLDVNMRSGVLIKSAALKGHIKILDYFLTEIGSINVQNISAALGVAVSEDRKEVVELLLNKRPQIDVFDGVNSAIENSNMEMFNFLLTKNIDLKLKKNGHKLLRAALYVKNFEMLDILIKNGAEYYPLEIINCAVSELNINLVKYLFEKNPNLSLDIKNNIFHNAINCQGLEIIRYIKEQKIEIDADDYRALFTAVQTKNMDVIKFLVVDCDANTECLNNHYVDEDIRIWINKIKLAKKLNNKLEGLLTTKTERNTKKTKL